MTVSSGEGFCWPSTRIFGWADNRRMVHQSATGFPTNTPRVSNLVLPPLRPVALPGL